MFDWVEEENSETVNNLFYVLEHHLLDDDFVANAAKELAEYVKSSLNTDTESQRAA